MPLDYTIGKSDLEKKKSKTKCKKKDIYNKDCTMEERMSTEQIIKREKNRCCAVECTVMLS